MWVSCQSDILFVVELLWVFLSLLSYFSPRLQTCRACKYPSSRIEPHTPVVCQRTSDSLCCGFGHQLSVIYSMLPSELFGSALQLNILQTNWHAFAFFTDSRCFFCNFLHGFPVLEMYKPSTVSLSHQTPFSQCYSYLPNILYIFMLIILLNRPFPDDNRINNKNNDNIDQNENDKPVGYLTCG